MTADFRRWLAIGTGVGIEIRGEALTVTVARVRPSGVEVIGAAGIEGFTKRPAAEWGREYADFLKECGASHLAATVLLPRREVIVRQLALPGVGNRDLAAAIQFQLDSLHPFPEDQAAAAWARVGSTETALVGIAARPVIDRYMTLFAEAGIRVSSFTFSAAALYSAVRVAGKPPAEGFLGLCETGEALEAYGESPSRPIFSAALDLAPDRAAALAASELRLPESVEPVKLLTLLPAPKRAPEQYDLSRNTLGYAAALAGASPWPALPVNLLPAERRSSSSRAMFVPAAALAVLLIAALVAWASITPIEDRRYLAALDAEIARLEPQAKRAESLDRAIEAARARARLLEGVRSRTKADLDALLEVTHLLAPPTWLNSLELARDSLTIAGQSDRAGELLTTIDGSPLFRDSEFVVPLVRAEKFEIFRLRSMREGAR